VEFEWVRTNSPLGKFWLENGESHESLVTILTLCEQHKVTVEAHLSLPEFQASLKNGEGLRSDFAEMVLNGKKKVLAALGKEYYNEFSSKLVAKIKAEVELSGKNPFTIAVGFAKEVKGEGLDENSKSIVRIMCLLSAVDYIMVTAKEKA